MTTYFLEAAQFLKGKDCGAEEERELVNFLPKKRCFWPKKALFLPKDLQKVRKSRQIFIRDKIVSPHLLDVKIGSPHLHDVSFEGFAWMSCGPYFGQNWILKWRFDQLLVISVKIAYWNLS